jgi:cytochrome P450
VAQTRRGVPSRDLTLLRQLGPIYTAYFRKRRWVVLAGLEANEFVWRNWQIWDYSTANDPFLDEMGADHVTALDREHHRDKRAILKPAFDQAPAMRFLPEFHRLVTALPGDLRGYSGGKLPLKPVIRLFNRRTRRRSPSN